MKITIEVPDTVLLVTYQVVYDDPYSFNMKITQKVLDTNAINNIREGKPDENA